MKLNNTISLKNKLTSYLLIFLSLFLINSSLFSQDIPFSKKSFPEQRKELKKARKNIRKGDRYYRQGLGMYINAIKHYSKAWEFNPNNALLNYKIGRCFINSIQRASSVKYFEKAYNINPKTANDLCYLLGLAYQLNLEFDKAIATYDKCKQTLPPRGLISNYPITIEMLNKRIEECNNGKSLINHPVRVFVDNLGPNINSEYPDYSPVVSKNDSVMYFTSKRENTTKRKRAEENMKYFEDIYKSFNVNDIWQEAKNDAISVNTDLNDAIVAIYPDNETLLIYKGSNGGDIYKVRIKRKGRLAKPKKLSKRINSKYHETSACITKDENTIYFTSNRKEGLGGGDIYYSKKNEKGKWGKAVNIGNVINTIYDENSIFLSDDEQTLYFSSKGHNSIGGYDIFKSVLENGMWSAPQNLGYPINTPADELYYKLLPDGFRAYMASTRDEGSAGDFDIYMITFLGDEKQLMPVYDVEPLALTLESFQPLAPEGMIKLKTLKQTIVKGTILDDFSSEPISSMIEITDNKTNTLIDTIKTPASGNYMISLPSGRNYGIAVKADNYLFHSENFDIPATTEYQEITKDIRMKKIEVGTKIVLNNIFFDFAKATLRNESTAELDRLTKLMNEMPELKIEISGHTDNKGSAKANQALSERRAKTVVDYLLGQGILKDRLTYKGYGQTQPIATNDTDEGRQLNRRTEFKITGK